jgi:hypothetical protein
MFFRIYLKWIEGLNDHEEMAKIELAIPILVLPEITRTKRVKPDRVTA